MKPVQAFFLGALGATVCAFFFGGRIWLLAGAAAVNGDITSKVTFVDFLTVTLTALCALLAALGLGLATLAVVGYRDIKDTVTDKVLKAITADAADAVNAALVKKLSEYPDAKEVRSKMEAFDAVLETQKRLQALFSADSAEPLGVAKASKRKQDGAGRKSPPPKYPGVGKGL